MELNGVVVQNPIPPLVMISCFVTRHLQGHWRCGSGSWRTLCEALTSRNGYWSKLSYQVNGSVHSTQGCGPRRRSENGENWLHRSNFVFPFSFFFIFFSSFFFLSFCLTVSFGLSLSFFLSCFLSFFLCSF